MNAHDVRPKNEYRSLCWHKHLPYSLLQRNHRAYLVEQEHVRRIHSRIGIHDVDNYWDQSILILLQSVDQREVDIEIQAVSA